MADAMSVQQRYLAHGRPLPMKTQACHQLLNRHTSKTRKFTSQKQKGYVLSTQYSFMGDCDYECNSLYFGYDCHHFH
jgi:hypothetical protein